ncbi:hypothetical protein FACS1894219_12630 [Clostridia bacterium]|nr:hypothetical protein FACS1894219_12630 [Clostridia bacterium]
MTPKTKTRVAFDFSFDIDGERRKSYDKLVQLICPARWGSGIDIFGFMNESHSLLFDFIKLGAITIDECEYEADASQTDRAVTERIKTMLGKRRLHPVLRDMAVLFADEPFEKSVYPQNSIYLPNIKALVRADGMKPENIADILAADDCDKIILFPYFPPGGKTAYYELSLGIPKEQFADFLRRVYERRENEMNEEIRRVLES